MKKFLLLLLIAFIACTKVEDIDFRTTPKEMRNDKFLNPKDKISMASNSTTFGNNSTKNDSDTDGEDDPDRPTNILKEIWKVIKNAWNWLKAQLKLEKIKNLLIDLGKQAAIEFCSQYIDRSICEKIVNNL